MAKKKARVNVKVDPTTGCMEVADSARVDCDTPGCLNPLHSPPDGRRSTPAKSVGRPPMTMEERIRRYVEDYGDPDSHWIMSRHTLPGGGNTRSIVYAMGTGESLGPYVRLRASCGEALCCNPAHMEAYKTAHREMVERKEAQQRAIKKKGGKF